MLDAATYPQWTKAFNPNPTSVSYFEGSWEKGSKMRFIGPDETGQLGGMVSEIAENRPYEFISIHHLGLFGNGVEDTTSDEAKKWQGFENYTLKEIDNKTELLVDIDVDFDEDFTKYFEEAWPKALQKLKELSEK